MSNAAKIKTLLIAALCIPNLISIMRPNGIGILYEVLPPLLLGSVGIPLFQLINVFVIKAQLDMPSWNDNLFKKNKTLSRYQFMAVLFIVISLCWIIKTAIQYRDLNGNGLMAFSFGIGILSGTYTTAFVIRSKIQRN